MYEVRSGNSVGFTFLKPNLGSASNRGVAVFDIPDKRLAFSFESMNMIVILLCALEILGVHFSGTFFNVLLAVITTQLLFKLCFFWRARYLPSSEQTSFSVMAAPRWLVGEHMAFIGAIIAITSYFFRLNDNALRPYLAILMMLGVAAAIFMLLNMKKLKT